MKLHEQQKSLEVGMTMQIPESVIALRAIVGFWQPNMDYNYNKKQLPPEMKPKRSLANILNWLGRRDRGVIWKQVNEEISRLGLANTKDNRQAIYHRISKQKTGKME